MSGHCMRVTQRIVAPMSDQSVLSEQATVLSITDEGAGEYLVVSQHGGGSINITGEEWPLLRDVIEKMLKECQE
jgi:hypothetical protein